MLGTWVEETNRLILEYWIVVLRQITPRLSWVILGNPRKRNTFYNEEFDPGSG